MKIRTELTKVDRKKKTMISLRERKYYEKINKLYSKRMHSSEENVFRNSRNLYENIV